MWGSRNRIIGMRIAGAPRQEMREKVRKTDGTMPCLKAVDNIISHFEEDPEWDGENSSAGGRPPLITPEQKKQIQRILMKDVGKFVVTAGYIKKNLPALRHVRNQVVHQTCERLGYAYRDRRRKAAIGDKYKPDRVVYA